VTFRPYLTIGLALLFCATRPTRRVRPVVRARYAASGMLKSGSLAAYPE